MKSLITHPNFNDLGNEIIHENPDKIEHVNVRFENFPDSWPNLFIEDVKQKVEHREVTYIGDFSRPEYLFSNYAIIRGILDYYAEKVRVIVPFFPVGTMERISKKGEIATASYFADILSHLPAGRADKTSLHTFDIHALSERFIFNSFQVNTELHSAMNLLEIPKDSVITFPDDGSAKRFVDSFPDNEKIICAKERDGANRIITIKEGNPEGKEIIIVDDLIQSGNTIKEAADVLRKMGATKVTAFATHGVFPYEAYKKLSNCLDELIVTDSIPINKEAAKKVSNMKVLSIKSLVEKIIFGL